MFFMTQSTNDDSCDATAKLRIYGVFEKLEGDSYPTVSTEALTSKWDDAGYTEFD